MYLMVYRCASAIAILGITISVLSLHPSRAQLDRSQNRMVVVESLAVQQVPTGMYSLVDENGTLLCRDATVRETRALAAREAGFPMHIVYPGDRELDGENASTGLTIRLRGTQQLESFPDAKQAYVRAAQYWESLVETPISIVIDVDYGPTRFGQPFPPGALGFATGQEIYGTSLYSLFRNSLVAGASSPREEILYDELPAGSLRTDIGSTSDMLTTSPMWRIVGVFPPVADPESETDLGPLPSIQVNSNGVPQDFDPSDGIDPGAYDFEGAMLHEIGHILGFSSMVGRKEADPSIPLRVSTLDLFRVRPGVTTSSFSTDERILSSGGDQVFFTGESALHLSTGRPDGTGGDGQQGSHWKDDSLSGIHLGNMDPTLNSGERRTLTVQDMLVIDLLGYRVRVSGGTGNHGPVAHTLSAEFIGAALWVDGSVTDTDGDMTTYVWEFRDEDGAVLFRLSEGAGTGFSSSATINRRFSVTGSRFPVVPPRAWELVVAVLDSRGNASAARTVELSLGDPGSPGMTSASFDSSKNKLLLKGDDLIGELAVEVNGEVVAPPLTVKTRATGTKLTVRGGLTKLNLHPGHNRVRLIRNGIRSNIVFLVV